MPACYKCGEAFLQDNLAFDAVCQRCSSWLHSCANCLHYDECGTQKCREPKAPFVSDRNGKNECPYFRVRQVLRDDRNNKKISPRGEQADREGRAREELQRLFSS